VKLTVIIPVYNEAATILEVLDRVRKCGVKDLETIIVDDHSTDGTGELLEGLPQTKDFKYFKHSKNMGKGASIRTAQPHVTGEAVVIQDADLEYDPSEFPRMLSILEQDMADTVYGSRFSGSEILVDTYVHYIGNKILTVLSNIFSNLHLTDMETCYKMIRTEVFKSLVLKSNGFDIEPEITAKLSRRGCRIYEVPIRYRARNRLQGKKIGWRDGLKAMWAIAKYNVKP
jgi:glycosyltransferase involved in cell wall biosynthesis